MPTTPPNDRAQGGELARTTLGVLFLVALIGASAWVIRPFVPSLIWATMLVVSTWPLLLRVQARLRGRRGPAVAVMTAVVVVLVAAPIWVGIVTIAENGPRLVAWSQTVEGIHVPAPPGWIEGLPLVGRGLDARWSELAALDPEGLAERLRPFVRPAALWTVSRVGQVGVLFVHLALTAILSAVLYAHGETAAARVLAFARRLAGPRGEEAVRLAGKAIRGVALGVIGTALVQSGLAGLGLAVAGVPYAGALTAVMFVLGVAQLGPLPILLASVAWLFWGVGSTVAAGALLVWALIVGTMDNFLRPLLIRRGADLPLLLIFAGVVGGLVGFGIIGLFIGPVLLAVTYTLLLDWIADGDAPGEPEGPAGVGPDAGAPPA